jgi:hypothetical protein
VVGLTLIAIGLMGIYETYFAGHGEGEGEAEAEGELKLGMAGAAWARAWGACPAGCAASCVPPAG